MIVPIGFSLGHVVVCPFFLLCKVLMQVSDANNTVLTIQNEIGASLHVYEWSDRVIIQMIACGIYF